MPFVANVDTGSGSSTGPVLRCDGSKAVPFAADVGPKAAAQRDGFDWGDAGLGDAAGDLAVALTVAGAVSLRGRQMRVRPSALG